MSLASNQMAEVGQNAPAPTNNFDMKLGARTKDWEDTTVATKCSKCGKARNTKPVIGKAMAAAVTSTAGKTPLTVENVQEAVVKAQATHAPGAAAFAGMHELERGNGFGLGEHTAFRVITEGATADDEGAGEEVTANGRGPRRHDFMGNLSVMALIAWLCIGVVGLWAHMGANAGEMGSDMFSTTRSWAKATINALRAALMAHGWVPIAILAAFMAAPTAAYTVTGIGHGGHAPAIYSAMHLRARARLDPAVWAPVENSFGGQKTRNLQSRHGARSEDMPQTSCYR